MLNRVTRRNARHWPMVGEETTLAHVTSPEQEKLTRFASWKAGLLTRSHALVKAVGDTITARWDISNTGGTDGFAFLQMVFIQPGSSFTGSGLFIPAGATVTLTLSGVINTLVAGQTYQAELRARTTSPGVVKDGIHPFSLTISPAAGSILTALGNPTII